MTRIPYPSLDSAVARQAADRCRRERGGRLINLYRMLLHAPAVATGWLALGTAVRYGTGLDDRTRELVICEVARRTGSAYEWAHHAPLAERAGVTQGQLDTLPRWREAGCFAEADRAVLAYTDAVLDSAVSDEHVARLRPHHDDAAIVELTVTAASYLATARFLAALDVGVEPDR